MGGSATPCRRRAVPLRVVWMQAVVAATLSFACAYAVPSTASATYADYDDARAAAQDLGTYGDAMQAADIPDGTYEVAARTDSYMCIFYRNVADAESRSSKERCYVQVNGGKMTAVFYISSMYNRLYLGGDARDAASLTNGDGTDDSNYLAGDPAEGYVPHLYAMTIPALNYPMEFAAFAGAQYPISADPESAWHTRAKWYSHIVVFKPTQETLRAIDDAKNAVGQADDSGADAGIDPDPVTDPDPGAGADAGPGAGTDPGADAVSGADPGTGADAGAVAGGSERGGRDAVPSRAPVPAPVAASSESLGEIAAQVTPAAAAVNQPQGAAADGAEAGENPSEGGDAVANGKRGLVMSAASLDKTPGLAGGDADVVRADDEAPSEHNPVAALAFGVVALVAVGMGCRLALFTLSKRTGPPRGRAVP